MQIEVLLADDDTMIREALRRITELEPGIHVIGEAEDGRVALELAAKLKPHVTILDMSMPRLNGIEATSQIVRRDPQARVIALSEDEDNATVQRALAAGACGIVSKHDPLSELMRAIRLVADGQTYLSPSAAAMATEDAGSRAPGSPPRDIDRLSSREREVMQLLAEGWSIKRTALDLSISPKTVETHRRHILEKLGLGSVVELIKCATREGFTSLEF
jgi:DNA-binding NarL/FixJ family response regulator